MALRDKIKHLIEEQSRNVFRKSSISGIMDDYGCFKDELPAVKNIFRTLAQNGYIAKFIDIDNNTPWKFEVQNAVHSISERYGFSESLISDILKEYALAIGIINSDSDWLCLPNTSPKGNSIPNNEIWYTDECEGLIVEPNISAVNDAPLNNMAFYTDSIGGKIIQTTKKIYSDYHNKIISNNNGIIAFENDLTEIWDGAFYGKICSSISLPNSIAQINCGAFANSHINNIELSNNISRVSDDAFARSIVETIYFPDKLEYLGKRAFMNNQGLKKVVFSDGITEIDDFAFLECYDLTRINLPDSIKRIGYAAFNSCRRLKNIILPPINKIEPYTFEGCSHLESVVIPVGITEIGTHAFKGCESLISITLPSTITKIGKMAFEDCDNLSAIFLQSEIPPILEGSTLGVGCRIYVPNNALKRYKSTTDWRFYKSAIDIL